MKSISSGVVPVSDLSELIPVTEDLGKIADFELINNWSLARIDVSESIITSLAKELNVTTDWLLTGKEETDQVIDTHLYKLAKEHEGFLKGFDCFKLIDLAVLVFIK